MPNFDWSNPDLFVVTAADGYTTATYPSQACLIAEAKRLSLVLPLMVHHWVQRMGNNHVTGRERPQWQLKEKFQWTS